MQQIEKQCFRLDIPVQAQPDTITSISFLRADVSFRKGRYSLCLSAVEINNGFESIAFGNMKFADLGAVPRFNAKTLAALAQTVQRTFDNLQYAQMDVETPGWKFAALLEEALSLHRLELVTPTTGKTRQELVEGCVAAARKPLPEIVESFEMLYNDGKYYRAYGFPNFAQLVEPYVKRSTGFVFVAPDGCSTYAPKCFHTREEAQEFSDSLQADRDSHFRKELERMSDEQIKSQAEYWFKVAGRKAETLAA